jgi:restriction system protein
LEQDLIEVLSILRTSLQIQPVCWEDLDEEEIAFDVPQPQKPREPERAIRPPYPPSPDPTNFIPTLSFLDKVLRSRGAKNKAEVAARQKAAESTWREDCVKIDKAFNEAVALKESLYQEKLKRFDNALSEWETSRNNHIAQQAKQREHINALRIDYKAGKVAAVEYFFAQVLARSEYSERFPRRSLFNFDADSGILIVNFELPNQTAMPTIKEVRYIESRDEFREIPLSETLLKKTYDDVLYQIALRTLHELYAADESQILKSVIFNGWVDSMDRGTGVNTRGCILSVQASRKEFLQINLSQIDPEACFRGLKGVAGTRLAELKPIRPILTINKEAADLSKAIENTEELKKYLALSYGYVATLKPKPVKKRKK